MRVIRVGSKGDDVLAWEEFLRGQDFYTVEADGYFDPNTGEATGDWQRAHGLGDDGVVGRLTWGKALEVGLDLVEDDDDTEHGPNWPPLPDFSTLNSVEREEVFGHIAFKPAGIDSNPEAITITNDWSRDNIVSITVPQLASLPGIKYKGKMAGKGPKGNFSVHKLAAEPMKELWAKWDEAGLLHNALTWAGMWNPRFIRGSRTSLSNHAYATAFDINVPWNGLRRQPALLGKRGCVRELIPIANDLGWYWGGHFGYTKSDGSKGRSDGMHFELSKV